MSTLHGLAPGLTLEVAAQTDRGKERADNEDAYLVVPAGPALALGVCDGMGGSAGGAIASRGAARAITACLRAKAPLSTDSVARALVDALGEASRQVYGAALADRALEGMGTTATLAAAAFGCLVVAQVGDSRAYVLREGRLVQVTRDQTLAQMLVEKGQLLPEEVASYPFAHVILQAVGTHPHVDVDLRAIPLRRGDVILVCSDGLHGPVPEADIARILQQAPSLDLACEELVRHANANGGPDNVTCVLARVEGDALAPPDGPVRPEGYVLPPVPRPSPEPPEAWGGSAERIRSTEPHHRARHFGALLTFFQRKTT
jgi:protein phosphatase